MLHVQLRDRRLAPRPNIWLNRCIPSYSSVMGKTQKVDGAVASVRSRTQDREKAGPGLVKKNADLTIFNQSKGKIGSYAHAARVGIEDLTIFNQSKGKS
jgi:hypothetical protein